MKNTYIILLLFTIYICVAFGTELDEDRGYTGTPATQSYRGGKAWCGACRRVPKRGPILLRRGTRPSGYRRTSIITWKKSYPKRRIYKVSTKNRSSDSLTKRKEEIRRRYRNSYRRSYPRRYRSNRRSYPRRYRSNRRSYPRRYRSNRRSYPRRYRSYRRRDYHRDDYYEDSRDDSDEDDSRDDSRNDSDEDDSDEESQDEDEDLEEFYNVLKDNKKTREQHSKIMRKMAEKKPGLFRSLVNED